MTKKIFFVFTIFTFTLVSHIQSQVPEKAEDISPLLIGEKIPEAKLTDADGNEVELNQIIKEKPTVLVFYRGGWCFYCNNQLSGLAEIESEIIALGYQIVAISPDNYQNIKPTMEADKVAYQVLSDSKGQLIKDMGIGFKTPEKVHKYIFENTNKEATDVIPVPTVLVVDTSGGILFEYINPNYDVRLSPKLLLANLEVLKLEF
ncbi:peroxiredoxin-like family protein [Formosa maritima]|uniref:thioredoxin-dependent peroxiredoxin n=1 Tax=Formosa maritima TaxID=2592046 RepID=A0A5D0G5E6_9FLAO|nr:peroxiredoxin-like family protein [Formosa maritima]TYA53117.1 AhpC/TSA family protein [Formosa maritima]